MENILYCGDNLEVLQKEIDKESADLIYIDPPFFSNKKYEVIWGDEAETRSFKDRWEGGIENYIAWMKPRVQAMYEVLKPTGSFYLHCDWHANAHLRIMLDEIFAKKNFRNEIIWHYQRWSAAASHFQRMYDTIFWYSKSKHCTFTRPLQPYAHPEMIEDTVRGVINGKLQRIKEPDGTYVKRKKDYKGVIMHDVWNDINFIPPTGKERRGYPTQKPEALLERIIKASSNKGDLVLDPFCGCGTTLVAAHKLGRYWIGIDISPTATKVMEERLNEIGAIKDKDYIVIGMPTTTKELKKFEPFEFQNWVIKEMRPAKHSRKKVGDMGLDGYFTKNLWHQEAGIQIKQSDGAGRNIVDNFETALKRAKYKKGYLVAFSFTKGAHEEAARVKNKGELEIILITIKELLDKRKTLLK